MNKIIQLNEMRVELEDFPQKDKVSVKVLLEKLEVAGHPIDLKEVKLFVEDHGEEIHLKPKDDFWNSPNPGFITKPKHKHFDVILDDNKVAVVKENFVIDKTYIFGIAGIGEDTYDIYLITENNDLIVDDDFKLIVNKNVEFFSVQRVVQNG